MIRHGLVVPRPAPADVAEPAPRRGLRVAANSVAILVNAALLVAAHRALEWGLPLFTPRWTEVLPAFDRSVLATIATHVFLIGYDARWFRALCDVVRTAFALQVGYLVWQVFPFDLGAAETNVAARALVLLSLIAVTVAMVVSAVTLALELARPGDHRA
jgi:hypothetical protein